MERVLVIAYGNPLRSDDGIAWQAAAALHRELPSSVRIMCVHQLTPDLAEDVSLADVIIFLDASTNGKPGAVHCETVFAKPLEPHSFHHLSPAEVLAMGACLYSVKPRGFLVSVDGECFDHGQGLSPSAIHAVPQVVAHVHSLIRNLNRAVGMRDLSTLRSETYAL